MIMKPRGYDELEVNSYKNVRKIAEGGYVCRIKKTEITNTQSGYQIWNILFDVVEGEYKDFYMNDYEAQKKRKASGDEVIGREPKYKGVYQLFLPKEEDYGTDKYEMNEKQLKAFITSVEHSNQGFIYNWQEATVQVQNKLVGLVFGEESWVWKGRWCSANKPKYAISVDRVRSGDYTIPRGKKSKGKSGKDVLDQYNEHSQKQNENKQPYPPVTDDDLPF